MSQSIHHIAQTGFSDASSYNKHRPTYTAHETDLILKRTSLAGRQNLKLVDLAAGTGLFTEALAARPEGYEIIAVEPHDEMRRELEGKELKGVKVVKGFAQELPIESGSVDGVFATQAFHWFATLDSLKEIRRILKPDGYLGLIWHVDDWNAYKSDPVRSNWEEMIKSHIWSHDDNVPRFRHGIWRNVFDEERQTYFETPIHEEREEHTQWRCVEAIWDRLQTYSIFSTAEEGVLRDFKEKFDGTLREVPKNEAGEVVVHGRTQYAWTKAL
ncbi:2-heptaprenyl-1,4-naphthoquinone methyltransferase, putative [Talaromyces stipitatus ATCC 10500]|uniref:2-heptaprenyl-1,4-naphthoquinone methyltransferase, putative n=1 Tax=Talaromyces stipitatus (strain ATCC 10500 / CBS 375.48 / QM 6759 / NRRL 1006) TaxID=441959 RepID=B8MLV4_TALSN|nr:2-heptaprenyl-1,4-naphthoquinone methyltransferase, putative [Talaromyces stipitatus ATCC 10500]EED13880.1 2-heptaprenyl-1,4-naphthoquinone methyltransferase, putative [Talaromyces stipitatus ATCC 10500]